MGEWSAEGYLHEAFILEYRPAPPPTEPTHTEVVTTAAWRVVRRSDARDLLITTGHTATVRVNGVDA
jgi:hypothetical protein